MNVRTGFGGREREDRERRERWHSRRYERGEGDDGKVMVADV